MTDFEPYARRSQPESEEVSIRRMRFPTEPNLPHEFRVQVIQILDAVIGKRRPVNWPRVDEYGDLVTPTRIWQAILQQVAHEFGFFASDDRGRDPRRQVKEWFFSDSTPTVQLLSAIEFAFRSVVKVTDAIAGYQNEYISSMSPADGIKDLNLRLRLNHLDYTFEAESGIIQKIDSAYLHSQVVDPALRLIRQAAFRGAETEFLKALEHHRHGRHEEAIADALKAFESTLKQICDERGWVYDPHKDTASKLIDVVLRENLIPSWMQSEFTSLRGLLEAGLPTVRNKSAGHGAGSTPRQVPDYLAAYALHVAAANIVFLVEAHNA